MTSVERLMATVLRGAWRCEPDQKRLSVKEWDAVTPRLIKSGSASLAWRQIRESEAGSTESAGLLKQAHLAAVFQNHEDQYALQELLQSLREFGVDPIVIKGWAAARHYSASVIRPMGDIDLIVRQEEAAHAKEVVARFAAASSISVDLDHKEASERPLEEYFESSWLAPMGSETVRILGLEDHLRLICIHMLRHGAYRPLWLCDIAAVLENIPPGFKWERCLGHDPKRADWVTCAIGLAHRILGADIENTPVVDRAKTPPRWLVPAVLKQWRTPAHEDQHWKVPLREIYRYPRPLAKELYLRWKATDPISNVVKRDAAFNDFPRMPYKLSATASRSIRGIMRIAAPK